MNVELPTNEHGLLACPCCGHTSADPSDPDCDFCLWKRGRETEIDAGDGDPNNNGVSLAAARGLVRQFGVVGGRLALRSGGIKPEDLQGLTQAEVDSLARELGLDADYT